MEFGVSSPSLTGNATEFDLGGTAPYGDALFAAELIGQNSPQRPDADHKLLPTLHHFIYDTNFYVTDQSITQVLEFDISLWMNGMQIIFGHQCNHLGDGDWDIWDNQEGKWVSADVPCKFVNGWNHLVIHMEREADNTMLYQTIELNGTTYTLNITDQPAKGPAGWWGLVANYQMDGNAQQSANTTYVDDFRVTYW